MFKHNLTPVLNTQRKDKYGKMPLRIRATIKRKVTYYPTGIMLLPEHWDNEKKVIIKHPQKALLNVSLNTQISNIEASFIEQNLAGIEIPTSKVRSNKIILLRNFIDSLIKERIRKFGTSSINHYRVIGNKIEAFHHNIHLSEVTEDWLHKFENHLRSKGNSVNTLWSDFKACKTVINAAFKKGIIKTSPFKNYKMPPYVQGIPEYLTEPEINKLNDFVFTIEKKGHKLAGMYFLLSCYTGYRLSDAKRFDTSMIQGDKVVLRAKKNGSIVSMPIHTKLKPVIEFVAENPLNISEQKVREYVKELCSFVGIKKHVKFHTSRHSFAMLLMAKGFSTDEVAELIGDTELITKIYARVNNEILSTKILDKLG